MKKLGRTAILAVLIVILSALLFVACNTNDSDNNQTPNDNRQTDVIEDQKPQYVVTVHPNNGNNSFEWTINSEIPLIEREGYYFDGIYLDSMFKSATSFESLKKTGIVSDIDVYVKWTAHKHEFGSWYILISPTHVSEGLRVWYCSLCNAEKYEDMQKIGEHRFSDVWTIDIDSTETSEGEKSHHCVIAGCTERKDVTSIPKKEVPQPDTPIEHTHSMILVKRVPATCTVTGYEISKCEGCDYTSRITLPIVTNDLDHSRLLAGEKCDKCGYVSISNLQNSVLMYNTEYDTYCAEYYGTSTQKDVFKFYNQRINLAYLQNTVETIESDSFKDWISLDHVIIPNSVAKIESNAFYGCASLKEISISNNVEEIEEAAFSQCINLETVNMSQSLKRLGKNVLYGTKWFEKQPVGQLYLGNAAIAIKQDCSKVDTIKEGTRIVADEFFAGQSELSIITIPSSIQFFGTKVFDGCSNLTGVYYNAINAECSDSLFGNMTSIEHTVFGRDVEKIPDLLFANCSSLADVMFSGNNVTEIGLSVFANCKKLTEISIPYTVTSIGDSAFMNCTSLTTVNWNATVCASAGSSNASIFSGCSSLATVNIGDSVTTIPSYAFSGCNGLESIYYAGNAAGWCEIGGLDNLMSDARTLYINGNKVEGDLIIPEGATFITPYAFYYCKDLTSVTISESVASIAKYAFYGCRGLTNITIPESMASIDENAFWGCTNLKIVFYAGIEERWNTILINSNGNYYLTSVTRVYNYDGAEHAYSFVTNCDQNVDSITATYLASLPSVSKDGYYFGGWYDNETFEGKAVSAPYGNKDKSTLYAKWLTEEEWNVLHDGTSFEKAYIAESGLTYDVAITTGGQIVYFKFSPTTSGTYTIQSTGSGDTCATLYNSSKSSLTSNDDGGNGSNFLISYSMTAENTYYIAVKFYSSSNTGTFKINIS